MQRPSPLCIEVQPPKTTPLPGRCCLTGGGSGH